jgi:hypothetical protein
VKLRKVLWGNGLFFTIIIEYTGNMDIAIEFNPSAFKHGTSKEIISEMVRERIVASA